MGLGVFIQKYYFNEFGDHISKLKICQNLNNCMEETSVELDAEISMDAELIGKFVTQQVAVTMAEKTKQYEKKIKTGERWKRWSVRRLGKKRNEGR